MGKTYRATGINLKSAALGENDRLLTILTKEYGLIRVVAAGARKHRSGMAGRSGLFVMNDLHIAAGRNLDRITQAETIYAFTGLGQNLSRLTAAQYLAELVMVQALSAQPQEELFGLLSQQLKNLESKNLEPKNSSPDFAKSSAQNLLKKLNSGIYQLLAIAGFAPELLVCCLTRQALVPNLTDPHWQTGFSISDGGVVKITPEFNQSATKINYHLNGRELNALQSLATPNLAPPNLRSTDDLENDLDNVLDEPHLPTWIRVERILRAYAQYHFDRPILSAALIDSCFNL